MEPTSPADGRPTEFGAKARRCLHGEGNHYHEHTEEGWCEHRGWRPPWRSHNPSCIPRATHYERVPVHCSRVQGRGYLKVLRLVVVPLTTVRGISGPVSFVFWYWRERALPSEGSSSRRRPQGQVSRICPGRWREGESLPQPKTDSGCSSTTRPILEPEVPAGGKRKSHCQFWNWTDYAPCFAASSRAFSSRFAKFPWVAPGPRFSGGQAFSHRSMTAISAR